MPQTRYSPSHRPSRALVEPRECFPAIDLHACGQVGRVVFGGYGPLDPPGRSIAERAAALRCDNDRFRLLMLREPRGYPLDCVSLVLAPDHPDAQAGMIVMEQQDEYPAMSGSNILCVVTALLETGALPITGPETSLTLETPGGLVDVTAVCDGGRVRLVKFRNLPSFATQLGASLDVPGFGRLSVDVAFGGMAYVQVDADALGLELSAAGARAVRDAGVAIGNAARRQLRFEHPTNPPSAASKARCSMDVRTRRGTTCARRRCLRTA
jgi:proline racemase